MHALIETATLTDRGERFDFGENPVPDFSHKGLKWVPVVVTPNPSFDPATEKLQRAADVITLTELTESQEVVAKTAQEQADYADQQDRQAKLAAVGGAVATLRTWASTAGSTTVTGANAVAVLQGVLDNLAVFYDRFADLIEGQYMDK